MPRAASPPLHDEPRSGRPAQYGRQHEQRLLARWALKGHSFTPLREPRQAVSQSAEAYNKDAAPLEWKAVVHQVQFANSYADLRK